MSTITWDDLVEQASDMKVPTCILKAIFQIESASAGFLPDGRPKILFESNQFRQRLAKHGFSKSDISTLMAQNPDIITAKWVRNYKGGAKEYTRLEKAMGIHKAAALESASWGSFQIMGFNYEVCGYENVFDFVHDQEQSEYQQLKAFCAFLKGTTGMLNALRMLDYRGIAKRYNGPGYEQNNYHVKLETYYKKCLNS
jgi:hypothetical protein